MPAVLTPTMLSDLVATTLRDLGRPKITEIATDLQKHTAMKNLLNRNRVTFQGGLGAQWDVMVNHAQSASNVGLGASDNISIVDTTVQAQADWRNSTCNWAIIGQEISMNQGAAKIVDLVKLRRGAALISLSELMEGNWWGPPVTSTDEVTPWGVKTWVVKNATEGFNGAAPSGFTTIGLNPSTYTRWKNYTAQYTDVTKSDLIRKWRKAATFTKFEPPVDNLPPSTQMGDDIGYFTNYTVLGLLEEALEAQNENLGSDIASQDGEVVFRRLPVTWVPKLEADTTGCVYGLQFGHFKTVVLSGWWLKETEVPVYPGQHTVSAYFMDSTYQFVCTNRRAQFVLSTGTTEPS
jgi:hypothetical protein